jgi:PAB-dependent poly(A)-specific ribonuclease subunit 2
MDADWDELRVIPHIGPLPNALSAPISTLAFDNSQELLWLGSQYGRVMSCYGPELAKYTSHKGHPNDDVRQIIFHEKGVITLSAHHVHMSQRTGPTVWHLTDTNFVDLRCMSFTTKDSSELLVAGAQDYMFKIDVERGQILETVGNWRTDLN